MYYTINFEGSRVPWDERAEYVRRLDSIVRASVSSQYNPTRAYRDNFTKFADDIAVIRSEYPARSYGENTRGLMQVLRELSKRGCYIFDYVSCRRFSK